MTETGFAIKDESGLFTVFQDEGDADFFLKYPPTGVFEKIGVVILDEGDIWMLNNTGTRPRSFDTTDLKFPQPWQNSKRRN